MTRTDTPTAHEAAPVTAHETAPSRWPAPLWSPIPPGRRLRVVAVDALLAIGLFLVFGGALAPSMEWAPAHVVATSMAVLAVIALLVRRLYPILSSVVIGLSGLVTLALLVSDGDPLYDGGLAAPVQVFGVASLVSLYTVTVHAPQRVSRVALGVTLAAGLTVVVAWDALGHVDLYATLFGGAVASALIVGMWSMGRVRRARTHELQMLAERNRALAAEQAATAERAATDERTRIAREMHDIVAHSLSAVIAQADGGRYAARTDPAAGVTALETISTTARAALSDMRSLLGVLREDEPRDTAAPRGATDIEALVEEARAAGTDITLARRGTARDLPAGLGLTAYRIVQEALTNVRVHAPAGTRVRVEIGWDDDELGLVIEDTEPSGTGPRVPSAAVPSGGRGILGMRERAALHGGSLEARPTAAGFRVTARLPLPPTTSEEHRRSEKHPSEEHPSEHRPSEKESR